MRNERRNRILCLLIAAITLLAFCAGCGGGQGATPGPVTQSPTEAASDGGRHLLRVAVIYDGSCSDGSWTDTFAALKQSLTLCVEAFAEDVSQLDGELNKLPAYDIYYLDRSLAGSDRGQAIRTRVQQFVSEGATAVLANELHALFDPDFIGASRFEKLDGYPWGMVALSAGDALRPLQELIADYAFLYQNYPEFSSDLEGRDYGYAAECTSAQPIIGWGAYALYSLNSYGSGSVFFLNPLLPNAFSVNGFSMEKRSDTQAAFASTSASCNQLLLGAISEYVFQQRYGYSLSRVFGSFGGSNMAWELHFEEITGIENGSARIFGELCRESGQIPSYTLIRNTYRWFLRQESVTYLPGSSAGGYEMDLSESAYSSGRHIAADGGWLGLAYMENGGSYFSDYPEYDLRAVPAAADFTGDGLIDLVVGGIDGRLYFFRGEGCSDRLHVTSAGTLVLRKGEALKVRGFSAPCVCDWDGNGVWDLVSGADDGRVYLLMGSPGPQFEPPAPLQDLGGETQTMPAVGDLDGDGTDDLVIGTGDGRLLACFGSLSGALEDLDGRVENLSPLGSWLSPCIYDYNGDGLQDLVIGTYDGYIALRLNDGRGGFSDAGCITCSEPNYKGNNNLKFGNWCSPRFADLDGDGFDELLCGSQEYGMAVPIDSEYFPFESQLREQLDYMRENEFYCGAHFYTNAHATPAREAFELRAQLASRAYYGLPNEGIGANQHTWYTSSAETAQSFHSLWDSGILWESGFMAANAASVTPQTNPQNVISLPFFLEQDGQRTILMQNNSTLLYMDEKGPALSAKYGMPVCVYYHCDFAYRDADAERERIAAVEDFRQTFGYNFVREDQMMKASAAAYNLTVDARMTDGVLTLTPGCESGDGALYDPAYQAACGVRLRFADKAKLPSAFCDAAVLRRTDDALYLSLAGETHLRFDGGGSESRIERVNVPAEVTLTAQSAELVFADGGLMQAVVSGSASTASEGWAAQETGGRTIFTKFGGADTLRIDFGG
ncbi:MAG: VCBS repeat-containing protein [Oscillospiraceae bacterium]|nr:VCBS repeat-containing protein [Oscillospiraceae bacterium]